MFNIDQLCPSLWDVCQTPHASYYRIRYILSNWRKIFQSLLFPGIQITRVALIYPAQGQITIANNKTYKKATSRPWIFVCFRGLNILNIIYPRSQELECELPALRCHRITGILLTLILHLFPASLCVFLCSADTCSTIPVPSLEGWGHTCMRHLVTIFCIALVLSNHASGNINAIWETSSPFHACFKPFQWALDPDQSYPFILVEETWQGFQSTSSAW